MHILIACVRVVADLVVAEQKSNAAAASARFGAAFFGRSDDRLRGRRRHVHFVRAATATIALIGAYGLKVLVQVILLDKRLI